MSVSRRRGKGGSRTFRVDLTYLKIITKDFKDVYFEIDVILLESRFCCPLYRDGGGSTVAIYDPGISSCCVRLDLRRKSPWATRQVSPPIRKRSLFHTMLPLNALSCMYFSD
jgi:hypothetical protein